MFAIGCESMIVAAGCEDAITLGVGNTVSADGAAPKVHCSIAPFTTTWPAMTIDSTRGTTAPEYRQTNGSGGLLTAAGVH